MGTSINSCHVVQNICGCAGLATLNSPISRALLLLVMVDFIILYYFHSRFLLKGTISVLHPLK